MFFDIDPLRIGNYTPYEVMLIAKQKRERETRLFEDNITLAWHTEAFARQKKVAEPFKGIERYKEETEKNKLGGGRRSQSNGGRARGNNQVGGEEVWQL